MRYFSEEVLFFDTCKCFHCFFYNNFPKVSSKLHIYTFWSIAGQIIYRFFSILNNHKSDFRKHGQGSAIIHKYSFSPFCTFGHCGYLVDVSLTFVSHKLAS